MFQVTMPGQPPSWNSSYQFRRQGGLSKKSGVELYQSQLTMLTRAAKPSGFKPETDIIVAYRFYMKRQVDVDNCMKMANDAIAIALDVNDKWFLPITLSREIGRKNPYTEIQICDADFWETMLVATA